MTNSPPKADIEKSTKSVHRFSIVSKIGIPLSLIGILLIIIASLAVYEFFNFRSSFTEYSTRTIPKITSGARLSSLFNQLLYQTERLARARSQPERRLAWKDIDSQFTIIDDLSKDITGSFAANLPTSHLDLLKNILTELNFHIDKKLEIERKTEEAIRKILLTEKNLIISGRILLATSTENDYEIVNKWFNSTLGIMRKTFDITFLDSLYEAKKLENQIAQQVRYLNELTAELSDQRKVMMEQLQSELLSVVQGSNGLVQLAIERIKISSSTIGKSNFASSLVEEIGYAGTSYFLEMNIAAQRNIDELSEMTNKRAQLLGSLTLLALIITTIVFIYFRVALIGRLIDLNQAVLGKIAGRNLEINQKGNDEISDIARSIHYFISELSTAKTKAEEANKAKSVFLAHMSHEIRTPLNAVIGFCGIAIQEAPPGKIKGYLKKIEYSSQSLLSIINDILDFSKIEAGALPIEKIEFNFEDQLSKLLSGTHMKCEDKGLDFLLDIDPQIPLKLFGDPLRLGQILSNLLTNAVKFTNRGLITLSVNLKNAVSADTITLQFIVSDTGIGITETQMNDLFSPFVQADSSITRRYGGTGLGMTITKLLIEKMSGSIEVKSVKDEGTTISFDLPFSTFGDTSRPSLPQDLLRTKVLAVEENPSKNKTLCRLLENLDLDVTPSQSITNASERIKNAPVNNQYRIILVDQAQFHSNKAVLLNAIESAYPENDAPGLIISAAPDAAISSRIQTTRENYSYISKPLTGSKLFIAILRLFGKDISKKIVPTLDVFTATDKKDISGKHILLVEDNYINQQVAQKVLENLGLQITIAENGREALEIIDRDERNTFDLIFMDVQMPEMDGYTTTKKIRELNNKTVANLPIIAMTAHAMQDDYKNCLDAGMNGFISKPIDIKELLSILIHFLSGPNNKKISPENDLPSEIPEYEQEKSNIILDYNSGMERAMHNALLYKKLLSTFVKSYENVSEKLTTAQKQDNINTIHTIKGAAGNIGANRLAKQAVQLEETYTDTSNKNNQPLLEQFNKSLKDTCAEIRKWIKHTSFVENNKKPERQSTNFDTETTAHNLLSLLKRRDSAAETEVGNLIDELSGRMDITEILSIRKKIDCLEYQEAHDDLDNWLNNTIHLLKE